MRYQALDANKITATVAKLQSRIEERFPASSLAKACAELHYLAGMAETRLNTLHRPYLLLRFLIGVLVLLVLAGLAVTVYTLRTPEALTLVDFIQLMEAGINDVLFIGLFIFFLSSLERRLKRRKVLAALHELRSLAHIVDMHQLTKDPTHQTVGHHRYALVSAADAQCRSPGAVPRLLQRDVVADRQDRSPLCAALR